MIDESIQDFLLLGLERQYPRYRWVEQSRTSAWMILDALNAVPQFVNRGIEELQPEFGGEPVGTPKSWWYMLMDKF